VKGSGKKGRSLGRRKIEYGMNRGKIISGKSKKIDVKKVRKLKMGRRYNGINLHATLMVIK
jgi:hypothetical protein